MIQSDDDQDHDYGDADDKMLITVMIDDDCND